MYLQSNIRCKHCSEIFFLSHYLFRLCTLFPSFYLSFFLINHYSLSLSFLLITSQSLFLSLFLSLCLSFLFITPLSLSFSAPLSLTPLHLFLSEGAWVLAAKRTNGGTKSPISLLNSFERVATLFAGIGDPKKNRNSVRQFCDNFKSGNKFLIKKWFRLNFVGILWAAIE